MFGSGPIERLHPAVAFAFFALAIVFGMCMCHPAFQIVSVAASVTCLLVVRGKRAWRVIAAMVPVFLVVALANPLFSTMGDTVLFTYFGGRAYTWESLVFGASTGAMFVSMLLWFASYSVVMTSDKFTYLFGGVIPGLSLVVTMALRLVPNYQRKATEMVTARAGVGLMSGGGVRERAKDALSLLSAMVSWALEDGVVTADSMRSRAYGAARRTSFARYCFGRYEAFSLGVVVVFALLSMACALSGAASFEFYPTIAWPDSSLLFWLGLASYAAFLLFPTFIGVKELVRWRFFLSRI